MQNNNSYILGYTKAIEENQEELFALQVLNGLAKTSIGLAEVKTPNQDNLITFNDESAALAYLEEHPYFGAGHITKTKLTKFLEFDGRGHFNSKILKPIEHSFEG